MILTTLTGFIVHLLGLHYGDIPTWPITGSQDNTHYLNFELRHQHAVSSDARVAFANIAPSHIYSHNDAKTPYRVEAKPVVSTRPPSFEAYSQARVRSMRHGQSLDMPWDEEEVLGPNVESRETLLLLAKMANDAYVEPTDPAWYDLGPNWNQVSTVYLTNSMTIAV